MKKLIISIIAIAFSLGAIAQSTTLPRFGTAKNQDNTGRVFTYGYIKPVVTTTSLNIAGASLNYNYTLLNLSTVPSNLLTLTVSSVTNNRSYVGDEIHVIGYTATTTTFTFKPSSTSSIAGFVPLAILTTNGAGKQFNISFIYDGYNFVEMGRFNK